MHACDRCKHHSSLAQFCLTKFPFSSAGEVSFLCVCVCVCVWGGGGGGVVYNSKTTVYFPTLFTLPLCIVVFSVLFLGGGGWVGGGGGGGL